MDGLGNAKCTTPLYNFSTTHSQWGGAHTCRPHPIVSEGCVKVVIGLYPNHVSDGLLVGNLEQLARVTINAICTLKCTI
jgi:hypothetical protein